VRGQGNLGGRGQREAAGYLFGWFLLEKMDDFGGLKGKCFVRGCFGLAFRG
jgi:hypothetical protein